MRNYLFGAFVFIILYVQLINCESSVVENSDAGPINVAITFTKITGNDKLKDKFRLCVSSLLKYATIDINFYIIGDAESQYVAREIFSKIKNYNIKYKVN